MRTKAVVFAYHNVGVRCLKVLLAKNIDVALVVTHQDQAHEVIWFESVQALAQNHQLPVITPHSANDPTLQHMIEQIAPDFIFSFYYRLMLPESILKLAKQGAFNMHGSLLPKYRGRVPVNWAVLNGEQETGATLHEMVAKPDAGGIIEQTVVPILPDDTASEVFDKVTVAAEQTLWKALPDLIHGTAQIKHNDLQSGQYYSKRTPEDGRISWNQPAQTLYNLIRAVAPPYPGAFFTLKHAQFIIAQARFNRHLPEKSTLPPGVHVHNDQLIAVCGDQQIIRILRLLLVEESKSREISPTQFLQLTQSL